MFFLFRIQEFVSLLPTYVVFFQYIFLKDGPKLVMGIETKSSIKIFESVINSEHGLAKLRILIDK